MATKVLRVLERVFGRDAASLPHYLLDAHPWIDRTDPLDQQAYELVQQIAAAEDRWLERLAELIEQRGGIPIAAPYPTEYTDTHYLAVDALVPRLVAHQEQNIARLKEDLAEVADDPEARNLLAAMLEEKEKQLEALRALADRVQAQAATAESGS